MDQFKYASSATPIHQFAVAFSDSDFVNSQNGIHDLVSGTLGYANKTAPYSESMDKERNERRQSRWGELSGEGNGYFNSIIHPGSTLPPTGPRFYLYQCLDCRNAFSRTSSKKKATCNGLPWYPPSVLTLTLASISVLTVEFFPS